MDGWRDVKEEIKQRCDILDVVGRYVKLRKVGSNFVGLCPFHTEKTPSFYVSPGLQLFHCFGCGKSGDIFTFIEEIEQIDFAEALKRLADEQGIILPEKSEGKGGPSETDLYEVNALAANYYHHILVAMEAGKKGLDFLANRGISMDAIKMWHLGFAPGSRLSDNLASYLSKKGVQLEIASAVGLVRKTKSGKWVDFFVSRVMVPLRDEFGRVVAFSGRSADSVEPKYINSPQSPIFSKRNFIFGLDISRKAIKETKSAVVMEGYFDVISAHSYGISNAIGISGIALSEDHLRLLRRSADTLYLALDADSAGRMATFRAIELAAGLEFDVRVVELPDAFKDPDEFFQQAGARATELWNQMVDEAKPGWEYWLTQASLKYNLGTSQGLSRAIKEVLDVIRKVPYQSMWHYYCTYAARLLNVPESMLINDLHKVSSRNKGASWSNGGNAVHVEQENNGYTTTHMGKNKYVRECYIVSFVLELPQLVAIAQNEITPDMLVSSVCRDIFSSVIGGDYSEEIRADYHENSDEITLINAFRNQIRELYSHNIEAAKDELQKACTILKIDIRKRELDRIAKLVAEAERINDTEEVKKLVQMQRDIAKELMLLRHKIEFQLG